MPLSPQEVRRRRRAILRHGTQRDQAIFPGEDRREFWQITEDRCRQLAESYNALGLAEYEAIEAFKRYAPDEFLRSVQPTRRPCCRLLLSVCSWQQQCRRLPPPNPRGRYRRRSRSPPGAWPSRATSSAASTADLGVSAENLVLRWVLCRGAHGSELLARQATAAYVAGTATIVVLVVELRGGFMTLPVLGEDESYHLEITPARAVLRAPTTLGVLRGYETLL